MIMTTKTFSDESLADQKVVADVKSQYITYKTKIQVLTALKEQQLRLDYILSQVLQSKSLYTYEAVS